MQFAGSSCTLHLTKVGNTSGAANTSNYHLELVLSKVMKIVNNCKIFMDVW